MQFVSVHIVLDGGFWPPGEGKIRGVEPPAKTCNCKLLLPPGKYGWGVEWTAIPGFTELLWCLLFVKSNNYCRRRRRWRSLSWIWTSECGSGVHCRRLAVSCSRSTAPASPAYTTSATAATWTLSCKSSWLYRSLSQSKPLELLLPGYMFVVIFCTGVIFQDGLGVNFDKIILI